MGKGDHAHLCISIPVTLLEKGCQVIMPMPIPHLPTLILFFCKRKDRAMATEGGWVGEAQGEAQGAVPGKTVTCRMAPLTPGVSQPKLSKNHMVANPRGYLRRGPGGRTWKNFHFSHGPTHTGCFPVQAFEKPYGRQS